MLKNKLNLKETAKKRLELQKYYEPKVRDLVETRTAQLEFNDAERNNAIKSIDAVIWKMTVAGIHLERLWEYKESNSLNRLLEGISDPKRFNNEDVAFLTSEFEAFLIQARAFVNVAQIHTLDACRVSFGGLVTNEKYEKIILKMGGNPVERLINAKDYFKYEVFGKNKWGNLIKSLRDKVVHFDRIIPSKIKDGEDEILSVGGLSLERLSQDFENGCYYLLVDVIAPIWERKWIAGPFINGMWK